MKKYQPFEGDPYKLCDVYFMDLILLRRIKKYGKFWFFLKIFHIYYLFFEHSIVYLSFSVNNSSEFTNNFYQNNLMYLKKFKTKICN